MIRYTNRSEPVHWAGGITVTHVGRKDAMGPKRVQRYLQERPVDYWGAYGRKRPRVGTIEPGRQLQMSRTGRRGVSFVVVACALVASAVGMTRKMVEAGPPVSAESSPHLLVEPDFEIANTWWPPLENVYTPLGWKNHLFRFNVYYSGVVMARTQPEKDVKALDPWCDLGVQVSILPSEKGLDPDRWRGGTYQMTTDNGRRWTYQGMLESADAGRMERMAIVVSHDDRLRPARGSVRASAEAPRTSRRGRSRCSPGFACRSGMSIRS